MAVTDLAFQTLAPEVFLNLRSNGIKKYKDRLAEVLTTGKFIRVRLRAKDRRGPIRGWARLRVPNLWESPQKVPSIPGR